VPGDERRLCSPTRQLRAGQTSSPKDCARSNCGGTASDTDLAFDEHGGRLTEYESGHAGRRGWFTPQRKRPFEQADKRRSVLLGNRSPGGRTSDRRYESRVLSLADHANTVLGRHNAHISGSARLTVAGPPYRSDRPAGPDRADRFGNKLDVWPSASCRSKIRRTNLATGLDNLAKIRPYNSGEPM